ncbi:MAG: flagellar biosynthesis anti-sigma factor FlgM [Bryobacterales bacterium]|nr:flagellar biosynthesis anti-sigma factor FlgM [Bryobacterales bacterium]
MRIDDRTLNQPSTPQSGATSETHETGRSNGSGAQISESSGGDRAEISSLAGRVSQALAGQSADRAQHLAKMAKEYNAGHYPLDSRATSRAIIRETLGSRDGFR